MSRASGRFGRAHIAFRGGLDLNDTDLKYARDFGSEWNVEIVDARGDVGYSPSLTIDGFGRPWIVYRSGDELKAAIRDGVDWKIETIEGFLGVRESVLATDPLSGRLALAYFDGSSGDLYFGWLNFGSIE